ncbi:MAG: SAM-dependent methyltransferase [Bacteroidetes bacterium]|nr:SAM-dependent methyltransferase [Bacteroidota bacterium]
MQRKIITTSDGSHSLYVPELNEHYHSIHGAIQESRHVFIEAGLKQAAKNNSAISVFEVGFGTGLNALLTYLESERLGLKINYTSVEAFPLEEAIFNALNYPQETGEGKQAFELLHSSSWEVKNSISENFSLLKLKTSLLDVILENDQYDLVYFDAFGPLVQPEMWTDEIFSKLYHAMKKGGVLVTYCSKGEVQRAMKRAGFSVEKIPGPPGKREMVRATKE